MYSIILNTQHIYIYCVFKKPKCHIPSSSNTSSSVIRVPSNTHAGVGKSCLLLQYTDKRYRDKHEVTIGVEFGAKTIKASQNNIKQQIWDTVTYQFIRRLDRKVLRPSHEATIGMQSGRSFAMIYPIKSHSTTSRSGSKKHRRMAHHPYSSSLLETNPTSKQSSQ